MACAEVASVFIDRASPRLFVAPQGAVRRAVERGRMAGVLPDWPSLERILRQERRRLGLGDPAPVIRPPWPIQAPPRRRGPQRRSPADWRRERGRQLAAHCTTAKHHPFDCDWKCLGEEADRSPKHLKNTGSLKGVPFQSIQAEAWWRLGRPDPHFGTSG